MMHFDLRGGARHLSTLALALALACPSLVHAQDTAEGEPVVDPEGTPPTPPPPVTPPPVTPPPAVPPPPPTTLPVSEQVCDDRQDDDGDGLIDCADADCFE
nr:hypothetical protein [Myxococcota bacterium]